jgi:hypothetical protein
MGGKRGLRNGGTDAVYNAHSAQLLTVTCVEGSRSISVSGTIEESAVIKLHVKWASVMETRGVRTA